MLDNDRTLDCTFIDICYPEYLTDHHNRQNERLLIVTIWQGMTIDDLVREMWDDLNTSACNVFKYFSEEEIKEAMREEVKSLVSTDLGLTWSENCEDEDEDELEYSPFLYAYLSW